MIMNMPDDGSARADAITPRYLWPFTIQLKFLRIQWRQWSTDWATIMQKQSEEAREADRRHATRICGQVTTRMCIVNANADDDKCLLVSRI